MAINYELLNKGGISLGTNFELLSEKPLDSRLVVPSLDGLQNYIDNAAAYEGLIAYVSSEKKHYEVKVIDGVLSYRPFGLTEAELNDLITNATTAAMEFKGATATLPENPAKGDMYKVAGENINIKIDDVDAKLGDSIVYDGEKWFLIPSGDDIEDTWRPVDGVNNDATLKFADGDKTVAAVAADGTIKYNHATIDAPEDITAEGDEKTRTYITAVETDGYGHITGYKTATENVEDTNTTYEFEGQAEESSVYFQVTSSEEGASAEVVYLDAYSKNEADAKLAEVKTEAANQAAVVLSESQAYADGKDAAIEAAQKAADDITGYVGTFTHDTAKTVVDYINAKTDGIATSGNLEALGQRVTANEGKIADLETESAKHALKTEVEAVDAKFADYKTAEAQKAIDDEQDRRLGVIEGDYLKAADIANFETKENVKKVADDFATYVESNDAALAAETKARTDADAGFETRIAALEGNFGDGEGTVEAQIAAAVKAEEDARKEAVKGVQDEVDAVEGRMDTAEGKITALETESAKHATKDELAGVDAKFADYTKTADLPTDLGDFTNNAGYAKTADVNAELDKKADKTQVATDIANAIAPLATTEALNGVKATAEAATTVEEVDAQIDAKIGALNLATTYEPIGAEDRAKGYVDQKFTDANLAQYTTEDEVKSIVDDVIKTATDKETLDSLVELVEYIDTHSGDAINMATAIGVLEGKVDVIEKKPAYDISATQISNWDNEVGAKALAETKTTAAEVKDQIEAYGYATTGELATEKSAREAKETELATAIEAAKTDAANQDAVVLAEAQKYADTAKADAIADAEGKVNALAGNVYTKEQTYTQAEVDALIQQAHTWGEF